MKTKNLRKKLRKLTHNTHKNLRKLTHNTRKNLRKLKHNTRKNLRKLKHNTRKNLKKSKHYTRKNRKGRGIFEHLFGKSPHPADLIEFSGKSLPTVTTPNFSEMRKMTTSEKELAKINQNLAKNFSYSKIHETDKLEELEKIMQDQIDKIQEEHTVEGQQGRVQEKLNNEINKIKTRLSKGYFLTFRNVTDLAKTLIPVLAGLTSNQDDGAIIEQHRNEFIENWMAKKGVNPDDRVEITKLDDMQEIGELLTGFIDEPTATEPLRTRNDLVNKLKSLSLKSKSY